MLPIQLCYDRVQAWMPDGLVGFDVFTDVIFILDIILNFHVGYIDEALVVVDKKKIRRRYLARWFGIDAIGSFPGDTIFFIIRQGVVEEGRFGNTEAGLLTLFKILKVPKLMRLGRIFKTLEKLEVRPSARMRPNCAFGVLSALTALLSLLLPMQGAANIANIVILLIIMVVVNHWISCLWFLMTKGEGAGSSHET